MTLPSNHRVLISLSALLLLAIVVGLFSMQRAWRNASIESAGGSLIRW
jgi:hypothetical protein